MHFLLFQELLLSVENRVYPLFLGACLDRQLVSLTLPFPNSEEVLADFAACRTECSLETAPNPDFWEIFNADVCHCDRLSVDLKEVVW